MQCQTCGADLPDDASFCIECGAAATAPARTGATVVLPRPAAPAAAVICPACGASGPPDSTFCVRCGRRLGLAPTAPRPPVRPLPAGAPIARRPTPYGRRGQGRRGRGAGGSAFIPAVFLIGMGLLLFLKAPFWPALLVLIGITVFLGEATRGRYINGLRGVLWLFGIAFLVVTQRFWWPGILILMGVSVLLDTVERGSRRP